MKMAIVLYRNDMTLEEQHRWWIEEHAPLGKQIPGLKSYVIYLAQRDEDGTEPAIAGTDIVEFEDEKAAERAFASEEWKRAREHTAASGAKVLRSWAVERRMI